MFKSIDLFYVLALGYVVGAKVSVRLQTHEKSCFSPLFGVVLAVILAVHVCLGS